MAADGYWRYTDPRYQAAIAAAAPQPSGPAKRPRSDYSEISDNASTIGYYLREEQRVLHHVRDTESIEESYDRYLRNGISSFGVGESGRIVSGGVSSRPGDDHRLRDVGGVDGRSAGHGGGRTEASLPPDASSTLFVEGLPANCTRREVSHIFRPFVGFREVRLVSKESRHPGGDPLILCFVDFSTPAQAAVALEALQGYRFDENDRDSANLRLQFARFPGPRSAGGPRGRR